MMKFKLPFLIFTVFVVAQGLAQRTIHVGDHLPDMEWEAWNFSKDRIRISDFRVHPTIIQLSAYNCGSSLQLMKKLNEFQQRYPNQLSAFLVATSGREVLDKAKARTKFYKENRLPIAILDTVLFKRLNLVTPGYLVWIRPGGKVAAITTADYLIEKNVSDFLSNKDLNWKEAWNDTDYDYSVPLLKSSRPSLFGQPLYNAVLPYHDGLNITEWRDSAVDWKRRTLFNYTMFDLYLSAFSRHGLGWERNRIVVRKDLLPRLFYDNDTLLPSVWRESNSYCYETVVPASWAWLKIAEAMREELNRAFGLNVRLEKREVDCWVIDFKHGKESYDNWDSSMTSGNSRLLISLVKTWNSNPNYPVLINGVSRSVNSYSYYLTIPAQAWGNAIELRKVLKKYGLDVRKVRRKLDFLVFD
jgi:hypothetical protein